MLYYSVVVSVTLYTVVFWGSSINKLVRKAGSVLGAGLESLLEVLGRRLLTKLCSILNSASHPLLEHI